MPSHSASWSGYCASRMACTKSGWEYFLLLLDETFCYGQCWIQPTSARRKENQKYCRKYLFCRHQFLLSFQESQNMQRLVDFIGYRAQYVSKRNLKSDLFVVFCAVCRVINADVRNANNCSLAVDGRSAAHSVPDFALSKGYVGETWVMRSVPPTCPNIGTAHKTGAQLYALMLEEQEKHDVVGNASILVHTATMQRVLTNEQRHLRWTYWLIMSDQWKALYISLLWASTTC